MGKNMKINDESESDDDIADVEESLSEGSMNDA